MSRDTDDKKVLADESLDLVDKAAEIEAALRGLQPNVKRKRAALFSLLYPVIAELIAGDVTQKAILALLATKGLKLHPQRFKELMAAEAKVASPPQSPHSEIAQ